MRVLKLLLSNYGLSIGSTVGGEGGVVVVKERARGGGEQEQNNIEEEGGGGRVRGEGAYTQDSIL